MTVLELTQDETIDDTNWLEVEPCACVVTEQETGSFWSAEFGGTYNVRQIRLLQRFLVDGYNYDRDYLRSNEIYIDDTLCTTVPDDGENNGEWFELTCDEEISGTKITINQMRDNKSLVLCGIEVKTDAPEEAYVYTTADYVTAAIAIGLFFGFFALIIVIVLVVAL